MEPTTGAAFHSDVQANAILAGCYAQQEDYLPALQHADAALEIAGKHRYRGSDLETLSLARDFLQDVLDGEMWPEDLLFQPAMSHSIRGMQLFEEGDFERGHRELRGREGDPLGPIRGHPDHDRRVPRRPGAA